MKKLLLIILAVMTVLSFAAWMGCSTRTEESITEAEWSISVVDADGKTVEFTGVNAASLEMVEIEALRVKKDGSETNEKWKGVLLSDVLEYCGIDEYEMVAIEASDGYSKEVEASAVSDEGTILGFYLDGKEVSAEDGLVQFIAATLPGNFWIKNVAKISLVN